MKVKGCLSLLCRGRKKKIVTLLILLVILLNAMLYVSFELYNTLKSKHKSPWFEQINYGGNSYVDKSGMRVIVGHYIGAKASRNLTHDEIHKNHYAPVSGAGEGGKPVTLSPSELIRAKELFVLNSFNLVISDQISINRTLPDYRNEVCRNLVYNIGNLPTVSVIIVFHNEAWSALMRNIMSVINRSPQQLLKEIILVDDASDREYLGKELEDSVAGLLKVRILRSKERSGLMSARLKGAKAATGDVLLFLDAHCEVTPGWLEPLLERAGSDDVFVCPHIDVISYDNLAYVRTIMRQIGGFTWRILFRWYVSEDEDFEKSERSARPYPTPVMAGGLFAVRRSLFWRLGSYDESMLFWGGENMELSWRAWQCGARVEIAPCSIVGHIFRPLSPYKFPYDRMKIVSSNLARAATVWMDEWADFVMKFNPEIASVRDTQSVADRMDLRKKLNCKSFQWYLDNVWPQHYFPTSDRWFGRVRNDRGACLGNKAGDTPGFKGVANAVECSNDYDFQNLIVFTPKGQLMADEGLCLQYRENQVLWRACNNNSLQFWDQRGPRIMTKEGGDCLTLMQSYKINRNGVGDPLKAIACSNISGQIWHFERVPWR